MLELTSFRRAVDSLGESLDWYNNKNTAAPPEILRDSAIQRFEYTYELAWKMMKRWLEANVGASYVDGIPRKELFRMAAEQQLIEDPLKWFGYHEARNQTSHIYDESVARDVFDVVEDFLDDVKKFLKALEERND
ncbi:MAG: nucleotidyltransferase substrate binding protein [Planctomycetota bacterium]|jgi:nucleotidyltransferase substrate binding protein (TIGR01987 family)